MEPVLTPPDAPATPPGTWHAQLSVVAAVIMALLTIVLFFVSWIFCTKLNGAMSFLIPTGWAALLWYDRKKWHVIPRTHRFCLTPAFHAVRRGLSSPQSAWEIVGIGNTSMQDFLLAGETLKFRLFVFAATR